jgi:iron complex outermembrane receptor protein
MQRVSLRLHAIAAASIAALATPGIAQTQAPAAETGQLERIVITSEKRMTVLDDTPASITALPGSKLQESGYTGIADVVNLVPNTSLTGGTHGNTQIFIRGIGDVFLLSGGDPGVALYTDGAYISDQTSSNLSLFDLQRVEVLRGPQGALYGRNATGGAVNLITAPPTDKFKASANLVLGNYGRKDSEGFVSGPVGGSATSVRLSYQLKNLDGWTDNPLAGTVSGPVIPPGPTTVAPDRLDELDSRALRLQTLTDLGGGASLRLIASHARRSDAGSSVPLLVDPVMIPGLLFGTTPSSDPRVVKSQDSTNRVEVNQLMGKWSMPVGDNTLNLLASVRKSRAARSFDADGTESLAASNSFDTSSTDRSVDVHLVSPDDARFTWLVGATALRFDQRQDVVVSSQVPIAFLGMGGPFDVPLPGGLGFFLGGQVKTSSVALYADAKYAVTPSFAILGGIRLNRDHKSADEYLELPAFGIPRTPNHLDTSWTSVPANIGVEYRIDPNSIAYARLSHGFKSGAVNLGALQPSMVKPENVTAAEIGYKLDFMQRRGLFSAALFTSRYTDMQVSQVGPATVILANASKARIDGAEFELSVRPVNPLTLNASLGLMNPRYTDFTNTDLRNAPTTPVNVSGRQLANTSKQQLALGAEYALALDSWKATLRADYVWRSTVYFTEFNTPDARQSSYGQLNLAFTAQPKNSIWKIFGYVKNATNTTAITSMSIASPLLGAARQVTYTPPRLFAIGLQAEF